MAYLVPLKRQCGWSTCSKAATVALRNHRNEPYGNYCSPHGEQKMRWLVDDEKRQAAPSV